MKAASPELEKIENGADVGTFSQSMSERLAMLEKADEGEGGGGGGGGVKLPPVNLRGF